MAAMACTLKKTVSFCAVRCDLTMEELQCLARGTVLSSATLALGVLCQAHADTREDIASLMLTGGLQWNRHLVARCREEIRSLFVEHSAHLWPRKAWKAWPPQILTNAVMDRALPSTLENSLCRVGNFFPLFEEEDAAWAHLALALWFFSMNLATRRRIRDNWKIRHHAHMTKTSLAVNSFMTSTEPGRLFLRALDLDLVM